MSYATREDIETLYGGDELRSALNLAADAVLGAEDLARIDRALAESASQIDSFVGVRYDLPLPSVPEVLNSHAVDLTLYRLALRNGRPRDELRKRYDDAVSFLRLLSKGEARLPGIDTPAQKQSTDGSSGVGIVTRDRRFDRDTEILT